jgi:hypothetical protein
VAGERQGEKSGLRKTALCPGLIDPREKATWKIKRIGFL